MTKLRKRKIRITFEYNDYSLNLTEAHNVAIQISKIALVPNTTASLTIYNLPHEERDPLITRLSAYNYQYSRNNTDASIWAIKVTIKAGYDDLLTPLFVGYVTTAELISSPPDIGIKVTAMTNYFDRSQFQFTNLNPNLTFREFAEWAQTQLGLAALVCNTSYDKVTINNIGVGVATGDQIIAELNMMFYNQVFAWIDGDTLYVVEIGHAIDNEVLTYDTFIGIPSWTEYGASFRVMFDPKLKLAKAVRLKSSINPSFDGTRVFVTYRVDYSLASFDNDFYITCKCEMGSHS